MVSMFVFILDHCESSLDATLDCNAAAALKMSDISQFSICILTAALDFSANAASLCAVPWPTTEVWRGTRSPRRPLPFGRTEFVRCGQRLSPRSRNQMSDDARSDDGVWSAWYSYTTLSPHQANTLPRYLKFAFFVPYYAVVTASVLKRELIFPAKCAEIPLWCHKGHISRWYLSQHGDYTFSKALRPLRQPCLLFFSTFQIEVEVSKKHQF